MIRLAEQTRLDAPRDTVWRSLSDPARLADALPNVSGVHVDDAEGFAAVIRPETSFGVSAFDMTFRLHGLVPGERMRIDGRAVQNERAVELTAVLDLDADGDATIVSWQVSARFLGPLGALAQRTFADLIRHEVAQALRRLEAAGATAPA
jgi:carbon monoxide dehydrogenase subunit G